MFERLAKTQALLEKHHRGGERFAQLMKETADGRFDADFWSAWDRWIAPVLTGQPPTVLDLGTGPATFLHRVSARHPGVRAIGVECAPYMLAAMGDLPAGSEILTEDLHDPHLSLAEGSVDAALASVVLHEMAPAGEGPARDVSLPAPRWTVLCARLGACATDPVSGGA